MFAYYFCLELSPTNGNEKKLTEKNLLMVFFYFPRDAPPIFPTDSNLGYKQMKAKIGRSKVRPWRWTPFTNPARKVKFLLNRYE